MTVGRGWCGFRIKMFKKNNFFKDDISFFVILAQTKCRARIQKNLRKDVAVGIVMDPRRPD